ncbi:MAG: PAS domain-containing protein, partial [Phycisphaerales bacterium]|nr:PAS domain-containing protein [Phycisphaerales bacterium]
LIVTLDAEGRVTTWNRAAEEILGLTAMQAGGLRLADLDLPWDAGTVAAHLHEVIAGTPANERIEVELARSGSKGVLDLTATRLGNDGSVLIEADDVSQRRALERQLAHAQKLESIGQLAAGIAHEINTPTQYIGDNTRFLEDAVAEIMPLVRGLEALLASEPGQMDASALDDLRARATAADLEFLSEEMPKAIAQSLEGIQRVSRIVSAMKEFAHPGNGTKSSIDLNRAISSTITVARSEWKYVADAITDFDPDLPPVPCLPGDLNQVVLNLIVNAAHAIQDAVGDGGQRGERGRITIATRHDGDVVEIRVSDTGCGIPEEIRERIFDPFFTTKEVGRGSGQGLALAYDVITNKHSGTIDVESVVGEGTTFILRLPLTPNQKG